jgi:hypothetical protein
MSWRTDTDYIIRDGGDQKTVQIKSASFNHAVIPPSATLNTVETATVFMLPSGSEFKKIDEKGQIIASDYDLYISDTSSVAVGHRIFQTGTIGYWEVTNIDEYRGHLRLSVKIVEGR